MPRITTRQREADIAAERERHRLEYEERKATEARLRHLADTPSRVHAGRRALEIVTQLECLLWELSDLTAHPMVCDASGDEEKRTIPLLDMRTEMLAASIADDLRRDEALLLATLT